LRDYTSYTNSKNAVFVKTLWEAS